MINPGQAECSVLILNYNGEDLLREYIPGIRTEAKRSSCLCDIVVVDNNSTDGSIQFLHEHFPEIRVEQQDQNLFLASFNTVLAKIESPYVILLNNDIELTEGFIDTMVEELRKPGTFAVSPTLVGLPGNELQYSSLFPSMRNFWFSLSAPSQEMHGPVPTVLAHGGASGYNREIFLSVGGFDALYLPGYDEDLDLSYRAIKMGYGIIHMPSAVVVHGKRATMDKYFKEKTLKRIMLRNHFLFMWKNISDARFTMMHFLTLPFRLLANLLRGNGDLFVGFLWALKFVPDIIRKRGALKMHVKYTDREIMSRFQTYWKRDFIKQF